MAVQKYLVSNAPFLRSSEHGESTKTIMRDLMIGLLPVILFAIYKNVILPLTKIDVIVSALEISKNDAIWYSLYPLLTLIVAPLTSLLCEAICLLIMKKSEIKSFKDLVIELKNGFGMFPGLFIVLISPIYIKMWELIVSVAVGEIIGKMVFGGFGQNIFNPALVGRAFMAFTFTNDLGTSCFIESQSSCFSMLEYVNSFNDGVAGATLLTNYSGLEFNSITESSLLGGYSFIDMFLGFIPGTLGETSSLAIIIGCVYLIIRRVIDWRIPVIYVGTVILNTFVISLFMGDASMLYIYPLFQTLSGGLLFGAVYMATEPVTSPKTRLGRIMYSMMLGVLTVLFRLVGNAPEGVATAIVTMNVFGLVINKYAVHVKVDGKIDKKESVGLIVFGVLFIAFFIYNVYAVVNA